MNVSVLKKSCGVVAAGILTAAALAVPAHGDTGRIKDAADVKPATMDIRNVAISNGEKRVVLIVRFADLKSRKRAVVKVLVDPRPRDRVQFLAFALRNGRGKYVANLQRATNMEFGGRPIACAGYRAQWQVKRDRVRIVVPQSCLHHNGRVAHFKAIAGFWDGRHGDYTDLTRVRRG